MDRGKLSRRQREIVAELLKGKTDREIAESLGIAVPTAKRYLQDVMNKWNCANRTAVAIHATELRMVSRIGGAEDPFAGGDRPAEPRSSGTPKHAMGRIARVASQTSGPRRAQA